MSFRLEEKIFIPRVNSFEFKKWLFSNGGKILYPQRIINSIYFDNELKMYLDSIEGITPRKKIRLRTYNNKFFFDSNNFKKEVKITYYNYRDKIVDNYLINNSLSNIAIKDKDYGICKPIINIFYLRNYFLFKGIRVTLDENITYFHIKNNKISNFFVKDKEKIIEIKSSNLNKYDFLKELFPQPRSRFSKYCRGIELLNIY